MHVSLGPNSACKGREGILLQSCVASSQQFIGSPHRAPGHTSARLTHTGEVEYGIGQRQLLMAGVVGYLNLQRDMLSVTYTAYGESHGQGQDPQPPLSLCQLPFELLRVIDSYPWAHL